MWPRWRTAGGFLHHGTRSRAPASQPSGSTGGPKPAGTRDPHTEAGGSCTPNWPDWELQDDLQEVTGKYPDVHAHPGGFILCGPRTHQGRINTRWSTHTPGENKYSVVHAHAGGEQILCGPRTHPVTDKYTVVHARPGGWIDTQWSTHTPRGMMPGVVKQRWVQVRCSQTRVHFQDFVRTDNSHLNLHLIQACPGSIYFTLILQVILSSDS